MSGLRLLSLLGLCFVVIEASSSKPDWTQITPLQQVNLTSQQGDGGLFIHALQIRTKTKIGSDDYIILQFTSDGKYTVNRDSRLKNNTATFNRESDDKGALTHKLQIKLSDPAQYKLEGCTADWTTFTGKCGTGDDVYESWTVRKNITSDPDYTLVITCNEAVMAELKISDYTDKPCLDNWERAMEKFALVTDAQPSVNPLIADGDYRLPPGCPKFPDSWYNDKNLRTQTYFPIPYEETFRLHCKDDVTKYRLLVGDRELSCDPYKDLDGGFKYSTIPDCVHADLRDWRSDVNKQVLVPIDLEMEPLQIRTSSNPSSDEILGLQLYELNKMISIKFSDPISYKVAHCGENWDNIDCAEDASNFRVWTIKREGEEHITVLCNDNLVIDFKKLYQNGGSCKLNWGNPEDQLWIAPDTTVDFSVKADITAWREIDRSNLPKNLNLEKYPVQIKTESALSSNDKFALSFVDSFGQDSKFWLLLTFGEKATYSICLVDNFELDLTECYAGSINQNEIFWTLERKENTLLVFCNGVEVIDFEKKAQDCDGKVWNINQATKLSINGGSDPIKAYRFLPKSCYDMPQDWVGVKTLDLPVVDGTKITLSCVSNEEINNGTRVVECDTRYPGGFRFQDKPECIRADGEVTFSPQSDMFIHDLANPVLLTCVYFGLKVPDSVTWSKDSATLGDDTKYEIVTGLFNSTTYKQTSVLKVKQVAVSDTGDYTCNWVRTSSKVSDVAGNKIITVRTLKMAHEGDYYSIDGTVKLSCVYNGQSSGTLEWHHNSVKLTASDKITITPGNLANDAQTFSLSITGVSPKNERGEYKCVWTKDKDTMEAKTEVFVRQAKILSDLSYNDIPYKYVEGKELELQCQFDGDKAPDAVTWFRDNSKITFDNDKKRMITSNITLDHGVRYYSNITLEEPDNIQDGEYSCEFTFDDGNHVKTSAKVLRVRVSTTPGPYIFVDYNKNTEVTVGCSLLGNIESVGVTVSESVVNHGGEAKFTPVSPGSTLEYKFPVTHSNDGDYECVFTLSDKKTFSATQTLIARKAVLKSSLNSSPVKDVVSGFKINLTCDIDGGASSIAWFKDEVKLTNYDTVSEDKSQANDKLITRHQIALVLTNDGDKASDHTFKCQGSLSGGDYPQESHFNSSEVSMRVYAGKAVKELADGHAYAGEERELLCQFPDSNVETGYSVTWKLNNNVMGTQDWFEIKTTRINSDDGNPLIDTRFVIKSADSAQADGSYSCSIKWDNGVTIETADAKLVVRSITENPQSFSMAYGAQKSLVCAAYGDKAAVITFYKVNGDGDDELLNGANVTTEDDEGSGVTTVGKLTPNITENAQVYCKIKWDDDETELKSSTASLSVLNVGIKSSDVPTGWVTENTTVEVDCVSDFLTENSVNYPEHGVKWGMRIDPASSGSTWVDVVGNKDIKYEIQDTIIENGKRVDTLRAGPIELREKDVQFKCEVNFKSDDSRSFYGGKVSSEAFTLKLHRISSFTSELQSSPLVKGGYFNLVCSAFAPPDYDVKFSLTNDKNSLDTTKYTVIYDNRVNGTAENPYYIQNYTLQANEVSLKGDDFYCEVQFNSKPARSSKHLRVVTYYDCTKATISSINLFAGMEIEYEDNKGDRTARISCPAANDTVKYVPDVSGGYKAESVCSKSTGSYNPPKLATCRVIRALLDGTYEQDWSLDEAKFSVCHSSSPSKFSASTMKQALSKESDICGAYNVVPCLKTKECTLDAAKTGCRWDVSNKKLKLYYGVKLLKGVWTEGARDALVNLPAQSKLRFWDCSSVVERSSEGKYLGQMVFDADKGAIIHRGGGKKVALTVGVVFAVLVTLGLILFLVVKRKKLRNVSVNCAELVMKNKFGSDQEMDALDNATGTASQLQLVT